MPKRSSNKPPSDPNQAATWIVAQVAGENPPPPPGKNPAAVVLGRLGGLKGGKVRAKRLSAKRRKEISQKAARRRWSRSRT